VRSMQLLGQQFVLGQTEEEALQKANQKAERALAHGKRLCFSLDMLGEGAHTHEDAQRYLASYRRVLQGVVDKLQETSADRPRDSLSIKLSALHPRFEPAHSASVLADLMHPLIALVRDALAASVSITLDAEESWRLELQLQ